MLFLSAVAFLLLTSLPPAYGSSFQTVRNEVENRNIQSADAFMDFLPEILQRQSSNIRYNLVYKTGSLQEASPDFPRIIVQAGDLLVAVTGNAQLSHGNIVEAIEFNPSTAKFEFHRIDFSKRGMHRFQLDRRDCMRCHSTSLHPIWESYPNWKGIYGSIHIPGGSPPPEHLVSSEMDNFKRFLYSNAQSGRYHRLPIGSDAYIQRPTMERFSRMNTDLTNVLSRKNFQRIAGELARSPLFPQFKSILVGVLLEDPDDLEPTEVLLRRIDPSNKDLVQLTPKLQHFEFDTTAKFERYFHKNLIEYARSLELGPDQQAEMATLFRIYDRANLGSIGRLRFLADKMGVDSKDWAMTREHSSMSFTNGNNAMADFRDAIEHAKPSPPQPTIDSDATIGCGDVLIH